MSELNIAQLESIELKHYNDGDCKCLSQSFIVDLLGCMPVGEFLQYKPEHVFRGLLVVTNLLSEDNKALNIVRLYKLEYGVYNNRLTEITLIKEEFVALLNAVNNYRYE